MRTILFVFLVFTFMLSACSPDGSASEHNVVDSADLVLVDSTVIDTITVDSAY